MIAWNHALRQSEHAAMPLMIRTSWVSLTSLNDLAAISYRFAAENKTWH